MNRKSEWKRDLKRIFLVIVASFVMAVNVKSFVRAGGLIPGGFMGLTLLIIEVAKEFFNISFSFSFINLLLNSIPVVISFRAIGKKFTIYSCVMIVLTSIFTDMMPVYPITYDILLISTFGGLVSGAAVSMCLFADATSGGTDFIAIYLSEKFGIDAWNYILLANAVILVIAGYLFGWDKALYSIIFLFKNEHFIWFFFISFTNASIEKMNRKNIRIYKRFFILLMNGNHICLGIQFDTLNLI